MPFWFQRRLVRFVLAACLFGAGFNHPATRAAEKVKADNDAAKAKKSAKPKPAAVPRHDPADLPFRMAPMPEAARSLVIPLATNLHYAFDMERLRVHTVTGGPGLDLFGPPYSVTKVPFICHLTEPRLWTMPPLFPWSTEAAWKNDLPATTPGSTHRGVSVKDGKVTLIYDVGIGGGRAVRVHECPRAETIGSVTTVVRRLEIAPCDRDLWFLAHAEMGSHIGPDTAGRGFDRGTNALSVLVRGTDNVARQSVQKNVKYEVETITEQGTEGENPKAIVEGTQTRLWLRIPAHPAEIALEIVTAVSTERTALAAAMETAAKSLVAPPNMALLAAKERDPHAGPPPIFAADKNAKRSFSSTENYRVETFPLPKEIELLVGGMDFLPNGDLAVCTWLGDVYIVEQATGPVNAAKYRRFARGLMEPMGLVVKNGEIFVGSKSELTRLVDTDGNGEADLYESVNHGWGFSGHYNAFSYGPALDKNGNFVIANAGHSGRWDVFGMGWAMRVSADGTKLEPICSGLREPNGIGTFGPEADVFVTENQGQWMAACKLNHVRPGAFFGHPSGLPMAKEEYGQHKTFTPPAIWFPYKVARSSTGLVEIKDDRFGPFKGQLLVGDFQNALVTRVMLEKVNGEWQGAMWPMLKGFLSGVNRLAFGPDGNLYVGGCQRTWAAVAPLEAALERVSFTGKIPFEVKEAHVLKDGFELIFTQPVDPASAADLDGFDVSQYTYHYHAKYGSPELDFDGKENSASPVKVVKATVSPDKMKLTLQLEGWRAGYVTVVRCLDVKNEQGRPLKNDTFYYTLNQIPK
ncbi:MAG: hypothetical protein HZA89_02785 [Verrucomicrobia bacterium]|nr:hypothetical protein [Verrucomicrobiota bacterium]